MFRQADGVRPVCVHSGARADSSPFVGGRPRTSSNQLDSRPRPAGPRRRRPSRIESKHGAIRRHGGLTPWHAAITATAQLGERPTGANGKSHVNQARLAPISHRLTPRRNVDLSRGGNG